MIIDNFNVGCIPVRPNETDAVPVVDPDGVLAFAVFRERFERCASACKIRERSGVIEQHQTPESDALNIAELAAGFFPEDVLGFFAAEGVDHKAMISRVSYNVKRDREN
jgi:hypothetical protein